jgi:3-hydroxyisobutyrate dehydrogenase/glyoxylate/succinic semialdehyde reductase
MTKEENPVVGFIGLGIMGSRMVSRLLKLPNKVIIHNRTEGKAKELIDRGAILASNPGEVAQNARIVFTMLSTPDAVKQIAAGEKGFLKSMNPGSIWVDCSTVNPSFSRRMAEISRANEARFIDAPVAGSKKPAEDGNLIFLVGGDSTDIDVCQPYFSVMGRQVIHVGGQGMGSALKMIANLMLGTTMLAFSEAVALGQALEISEDILFETFPRFAVVPPFIEAKKDKIRNEQFDPEFPLQWMHKDLSLASLSALESGTALPLTDNSRNIYRLAFNRGLEEQDFSAVFQMIKGDSGKQS